MLKIPLVVDGLSACCAPLVGEMRGWESLTTTDRDGLVTGRQVDVSLCRLEGESLGFRHV